MNSTEKNHIAPDDKFTDELQPGTTLLQGQYVIESFLNSGGFGMTYLAKDRLERRVVIKECFPASFCTRADTVVRARSRAQQKDYKSIVRLFVQEARRLSKLNHPNIVGVHQVFEDNETAYMVLDYVDGQDLLDIVDEKKRHLGPEDMRKILLKVLDAIGFIHKKNILHRDISPDNILLDQSDEPILIDFGAAREKASKATRALSALLVVKDGYSPQEFYIAGNEQGPASDIYALAATFYHMVAGEAPPNSQKRLAAVAAKEDDPYKPAAETVTGYDKDFLEALDKALNIFPNDRFQSAQEWSIEIDIEKRIEHALAAAQSDKNIDRSISQLVSETNLAVLEEKKHEEITVSEAKPMSSQKNIPVGEKVADDEDLPSQTTLNIDENGIARKRWFFGRSKGARTTRRIWSSGKSRTDNIGKAGL